MKLANIFASVLIVGQFSNIAIPEIEVVWWVLVLAILSTLPLYLAGASFLKKTMIELAITFGAFGIFGLLWASLPIARTNIKV